MDRTEDQIPSVQLDGVTAGYQRGREVVSALDLRVEGPGVVRLAGRNGAGKSTLLELVSGYLRPWAGRVLVNGAPAADLGVRRTRRVCRTQVALYPHMTVRDHLAFGARCCGVEAQDGIRRAERHGLGPWLDHNAGALSTGNARKVWLVMCTLGRFDVVVLDEPFNGIDAESIDIVVSELADWAGHALVLLISHVPPADVAITRTVTLR